MHNCNTLYILRLVPFLLNLRFFVFVFFRFFQMKGYWFAFFIFDKEILKRQLCYQNKVPTLSLLHCYLKTGIEKWREETNTVADQCATYKLVISAVRVFVVRFIELQKGAAFFRTHRKTHTKNSRPNFSTSELLRSFSKILGLGQFGLGPADKTNFGLTPFLLGATGSGKKTSSGKFSTNPKRPAERRRRLLVASWVVDQRQ